MPAYGMQPVILGDPLVSVESRQQLQSDRRSGHHRNGDGMIQRDDRVVGDLQ
jgi:hypothetical protein